VPADAMKWQALSTKGYKYKDKSAAASGVTKILLKSGAAGKAKVQLQGKGVNLPDPTFTFLPLPVVAQLVNSETAACFESTFTAPNVKKNDQGKFKAKLP
jgi:hypothetical protein